MANKTEHQAPERAPQRPAKTCRVSVQGAYIREAPGTGGRIVGAGNRGDKLVELDMHGWLPLIHHARIVWAPPESGQRRGASVCFDAPVQLLTAPADGAPAHTTQPGEQLPLADTVRWRPVLHRDAVCWISRQFTT